MAALLAKLVAPRPGDRIADPACGSGSLLIKVAREVGSSDYFLYGQEVNGGTWALCKMNMFLHGIDSARIEWGDTLNNPKLTEGDRLAKFDVVVANPPSPSTSGGRTRRRRTASAASTAARPRGARRTTPSSATW